MERVRKLKKSGGVCVCGIVIDVRGDNNNTLTQCKNVRPSFHCAQNARQVVVNAITMPFHTAFQRQMADTFFVLSFFGRSLSLCLSVANACSPTLTVVTPLPCYES